MRPDTPSASRTLRRSAKPTRQRTVWWSQTRRRSTPDRLIDEPIRAPRLPARIWRYGDGVAATAVVASARL